MRFWVPEIGARGPKRGPGVGGWGPTKGSGVGGRGAEGGGGGGGGGADKGGGGGGPGAGERRPCRRCSDARIALQSLGGRDSFVSSPSPRPLIAGPRSGPRPPVPGPRLHW